MTKIRDAACYDKRWMDHSENYLPVMRYRFRELFCHLKGWVMELGCGPGHIGKLIPKYYGVDWSEVALEMAKKNNPHGEFTLLDVATQRVPYPDNFVHTVLMTEIIEHIEDYSHLLSEAKRLARQRIVITVPIDIDIPTHYHPKWDLPKCLREFGGLGEISKLYEHGQFIFVVIDS